MTIEEMNSIKENRGYSFKKLSEYSGVPIVTLQKIFSGKTTNPRKVTLDAIERVLSADEELYQGKSYEYTAGKKDEAPIMKDMVKEPAAHYGAKKPGEYLLEDYYALPDEYRVELIDGFLYDMASPGTVHQDIIFQIHMAFYQYISKKKKSCRIFASRIDVQLCCDQKTMVQPDLLVVCDKTKIKGFGIYGAPDFVLEVLSKATRKKDMTVKLGKYLEAGVREYWMIDPYKEVLIIYDFTDEDYIPRVHPLRGLVPVALTEGELQINLQSIAESIKELGKL